MIDFRRREEVLPSALILLALIILTGTLVYMLAVPKPSVAAQTRGQARARRLIFRETADARKRVAQDRAALGPRLWTGDPDSVSAGVLALLTREAHHHALKLGAFRPQRPQEVAGLTELPFSAEVAGPYPKVQAVMASLDDTGGRVVLRAVQIASSEETGDAVTATLGLSAYLPSDSALLPPAAPLARPHPVPPRRAPHA